MLQLIKTWQRRIQSLVCVQSFGSTCYIVRLSVHPTYRSGSVITLVPFLEHSWETSPRHTLISELVCSALLWWRMEPQKLRVFQLENTTKHWQCILEGRSTEVEESVWFFSLWDTDNKLFLAGLAKPATLTLPASLPAWDSSHKCTPNSNSIWIWKWIHWLAAVLINL